MVLNICSRGDFHVGKHVRKIYIFFIQTFLYIGCSGFSQGNIFQQKLLVCFTSICMCGIDAYE